MIIKVAKNIKIRSVVDKEEPIKKEMIYVTDGWSKRKSIEASCK